MVVWIRRKGWDRLRLLHPRHQRLIQSQCLLKMCNGALNLFQQLLWEVFGNRPRGHVFKLELFNLSLMGLLLARLDVSEPCYKRATALDRDSIGGINCMLCLQGCRKAHKPNTFRFLGGWIGQDAGRTHFPTKVIVKICQITHIPKTGQIANIQIGIGIVPICRWWVTIGWWCRSVEQRIDLGDGERTG